MAHNIFENFDFDEYHALLDNALDDSVHLVHTNYGKGGFTFAWQRVSPFAKGKMIKVAVSFCSHKDQFCRKIGAFNALNNFYNKDETIQVPAGSEDSAEVVQNLRWMFSTL
jgi:hypothetical protein